ncbi:MAG: GGDEF domain-containing protein [Actinobacteria bacterium]|nr:GGDEF domain-containing protein [Actinomycetota bacterium]
MPAAVAHRRPLILASLLLLGGIFLAFTAFGEPMVGIGHFFYVPITLFALVTSPRAGFAMGAAAAALYALGIVLNPTVASTEVLTVGTAIRFATYTAMGALVGWFASDNRRLLAELQVLADRDSLTGLPNTRAFEAAIHRRLESRGSFALLIGQILGPPREQRPNAAANDVLLEIAGMLGRTLGPEDELARVGDDEFAVLTPVAVPADAGRIASRLEASLNAHDAPIVFGWATHPQDGKDALALYRAADERLYARRLLGTPARAGAEIRSVS